MADREPNLVRDAVISAGQLVGPARDAATLAGAGGAPSGAGRGSIPLLGQLGVGLPPGASETEAGSEWRPLSLPPDRVAEMQRQLIDAGILDRNDVKLGAWGIASAQAMKQVLIAAAGSGLSPDAVLAQWGVMGGATDAAGGRQRAPLVVELTSPEDIRAVADNVAVRSIGRKLNDSEVEALVGSFHSLQRQAQESAYGQAETGGEVTAPPDVQSFAQRRIEEANPQEHASYGMVGRYGEFLQLLNSVGGK